MGAAMMSVSSLTVVLNALRINLFSLDKKRKTKAKKEIPSILTKKKIVDTKKVTLLIPDMMCENCVRHIKEGLSLNPDVVSTDVSLEKKEAVIIMDKSSDIQALIKTIEGLGYQASIIQENK